MAPTPATPRQNLSIVELPPTPTSPGDNTPSRRCEYLQVNNILNNTPLTPPTDEERPFKRRCIERDGIDDSVEDALPSFIADDSWLGNGHEDGPQCGTTTWRIGAERAENDYEDQIFDSILAPGIEEMVQNVDFEEHESLENEQDNEVCFGMLRDIPFNLAEKPPLPLESSRVHVLDNLQLANNGIVSTKGKGSLVGSVAGPVLGVLWQLSSWQGMSVQLRCIISQSRQRDKGASVELCACLTSILYGPFRHFDPIGELLDNNKLFLQDPQGCDRNVRYRNSHRLSGKDRDAPMTIDREPAFQEVRRSGRDVPLHSVDDPCFRENLPMADVPQAVKTNLFKHQRQALYFMMERESGWERTEDFCDVWKIRLISGLPMYVNTISGDVQMEQPPVIYGGLLADDMGLGKTLSIISLVASDLKPRRDPVACGNPCLTATSGARLRCTLIIVPPTLVDTWESQLQRHCRPDLLRWTKHHGRKNRLNQIAQLESHNIVLTTYQTVASEWKKNRASSILFSAHWYRIVIDEAHQIRDSNTKMAKAICTLEANRRWAVTGTPIQNHLTDFLALLQFLRVHPYDNPAVFEQHIVNLWKNDSEAAVARIKKLITCVSLRRTSSTIELPRKTDLEYVLQFSPLERELNERLESQLGSALSQSKHEDDGQSGLYNHALQTIHALRSICNFGTLSDTKLSDFGQSAMRPWGATEAQAIFDTLVTTGETACARCARDVMFPNNPDELLELEASGPTGSEPMVSKCAQILCCGCSCKLQDQNTSSINWCGHTPQCITLPISASQGSTQLTISPSAPAVNLNNFPTKLKALVEDLQSFPKSKSVVFSAWRTTLDLAGQALTIAGIRFVRFDGKVADKDRSPVLSQFSKDHTIRVILFTISCGAVGLDLTAADRAYLMEPQWNPTVEDQALARVHRMGQQKPVTTVRFIIADSYEQRVREVQKRKKGFAGLLLSPSNKTPSCRGSGRFEYLRSLLH